MCGTALDERVHALQDERAAIETEFGVDVSAWMSDDYGLSYGDIVYQSDNFSVRRVIDARMPGRVCCAIYYIGK